MADDRSQFLTRQDELRIPTKPIVVRLYLIDGSQLMGHVFADPGDDDDSAAVVRLVSNGEPLLRFESSFGEFMLVGKGSIEAVLIEGADTAESARCFIATLSGHRFVGGIPGEFNAERLSDAVQHPWIGLMTDRGPLHVRSGQVLWIKT